MKEKSKFEFYQELNEEIPKKRQPQQGITIVPLKFHIGKIVSTNEYVTEQGYDVHPTFRQLILEKYPEYELVINNYRRPLGTTDATFDDFNKPQFPSKLVPNLRKEKVLNLTKRFLGATPYLPVHYVDRLHCGLPINTATGYHNRHSFKMQVYAKRSAPSIFKDKPTLKGYYYNAFNHYARRIIHNIKYNSHPFPEDIDPTKIEEEKQKFFNRYPTLLFTRNHISKLTDIMKQRSVYAVDELFLSIETMLTFPLLMQARKPTSCIMHGLETFRGGNCLIDYLAQSYKSYFCLDYSAFDKTVPRVITDIFFNEFLPS